MQPSFKVFKGLYFLQPSFTVFTSLLRMVRPNHLDLPPHHKSSCLFKSVQTTAGGFFDWFRPKKFQVWNCFHPIKKSSTQLFNKFFSAVSQSANHIVQKGCKYSHFSSLKHSTTNSIESHHLCHCHCWKKVVWNRCTWSLFFIGWNQFNT